ncbi:MAG: hypothetical protein AB4057_18510 [Crocosphaera sp.]
MQSKKSLEQLLPKESLESLADKAGRDESGKSKPTPSADLRVTNSEKRKNINNRVAFILALALWAALIITIVSHLGTTVYFSNYLVDSETLVELEKVQTAVSLVDNTAKTLYSFLGTLVTAVTAYYFKTIADEVNDQSS